MRALITGSAGFVGRHFARFLTEQGSWDITQIDLLGEHPMSVHRFFERDTRRYDLVLHCAAVIGGRAGIDGSPYRLMADNQAIDAAMWRWALLTRPGRIVYFSSSAAYPIALQDGDSGHRLTETDIDLTDLRSPDATYGLVKLCGEVLASHAGPKGVDVLVVRPFSGYGTDQGLCYPFGAFVDRARERADPFVVWGDGTQVRDWIHIDDIVAATMAALDAGVRGPVNLCTGRPMPFRDLAAKVTAAYGYTPAIQPLPDRPTGVAYRVGDPALMETFYKPQVTLEEGIETAVRGQP